MKSLTFDEFFAMPPGMIFGQATGLPHQFSCGLYVKGESLIPDDDDEACVVFTDAIHNWEGCSWPEAEAELQFIHEADLESDQPFLVYEPADLDRLAELIGRGPGWVARDDTDDLLDHEAVAYATRDADPSITMEEVRAYTSSIRGSMAGETTPASPQDDDAERSEILDEIGPLAREMIAGLEHFFGHLKAGGRPEDYRAGGEADR